VPIGGSVGQVLTKTGDGNYATGWSDAGGSSAPLFVARKDNTQSIASQQYVRVAWPTTEVSEGFTLSGNVLTAAVSGWYQVGAFITKIANGPLLFPYLRVNGSAVQMGNVGQAAQDSGIFLSAPLFLTANTTEVDVAVFAGSAYTMPALADSPSRFWAWKLR
jgi:hypothetical protein